MDQNHINKPPSEKNDEQEFRSTGTTLHELLANHDWTQTKLGPADTWPKEFRENFNTLLDALKESNSESKPGKGFSFQTYAEAMPQMAFVSDQAGNIIYYNQRWYKYVAGLENTKGWGWKDQPVHHPDDLSRTIERWKHSLATGEPYEIEYRLRRHDGEYRWHLGRATPISNSRGEIELWLGTNTDIHQQKLVEDALKESEDRFKLIARATNDVIWDWNLKNDQVWWNEALFTLFGYSDADIQQTVSWWKQKVHPDDLKRISVSIRQAIDSGRSTWAAEYRFQCSNGKYAEILDRGYILHNQQGKAIRMLGSMLDISERKNMENALRMEQDKLKAIIDNMGVGVGLTDPKGNTLTLNKAALQMHGFSNEAEMLFEFKNYQSDFQLQDTEGNLLNLEQWPTSRALRGEQVKEYEVRLINKFKNLEKYISYTIVPINDQDGHLMHFIVTLTDNSERKVAEKALADSEKRLRLAAAAANLGIFEWNVQQDFSYWENTRMYEIFNRPREDGPLTKEEFMANILHPDDVEEFTKTIVNSMENDRPFVYECRIRPPKSKVRWILYQGSFEYDQHRNPLRLIAIIQDITERKLSEIKLRESESLYRMLASNLPNGAAFIFDQDMRYILAAGKALGSAGFDSASLEGKTIQEVLEDRLIELYKPQIALALSGKANSFEHNSHNRFFKTDITPIFSANQEINLVLALSYDITERKQLEEKFQKERELLQTIYNSIPVMLTIYDPRVQEISWNKSFSDLTGYTEADHRQHNIMNLVYPDPEYQKEVAVFMNSLAPGFKDLRMVIKDGSVLESSWANVRISDGRNVGIGIDISQRKLYEKQLSELSSRLQTVVDNITDGVLVYMPDGTLTELNFAAKKILNLLNDDRLEDDLEDYLYFDQEGNQVLPEDTPRNRCLRGEVFNQTEFRILNPVNNRELFLEYSGIPVYENEELALAVITMHDITGRKNAHLQILEANENLKNKNYQLSRVNLLHENLLYIIAHDLRGPITNMQLILNMFDLIPDGNKKLEMMGSLQEMVLRQENIINGLGEIIQVQSPEEVQPLNIKLDVLLESIIRENERDLLDINGKIEYDFKQAPVIVFIKTFINSILTNLVTNAIKYNDKERDLRIEIRSSYQDQYFLIQVKDNGVGIDLEKNRKHLYRPFRRFTQQAKGTGIGLYIVKNLVEKNGGKIEVESMPGEGTTFSCFLKEYS